MGRPCTYTVRSRKLLLHKDLRDRAFHVAHPAASTVERPKIHRAAGGSPTEPGNPARTQSAAEGDDGVPMDKAGC